MTEKYEIYLVGISCAFLFLFEIRSNTSILFKGNEKDKIMNHNYITRCFTYFLLRYTTNLCSTKDICTIN